MTAYGRLLPVATMPERLEFQQLVEETVTAKRSTRAMSMYQFVLVMMLAAYVFRGVTVAVDRLGPVWLALFRYRANTYRQLPSSLGRLVGCLRLARPVVGAY